MTRRLLNLLTILSLLLCVPVAGLWVRSYFAADQLVRTRLTIQPGEFRVDQYVVVLWRGVMGVTVIRHELTRASSPPLVYDSVLAEYRGEQARSVKAGAWVSRPPAEVPGGNRFHGRTHNARYPGHRVIGIEWASPHWFLLLLCSLLPGFRLLLALRRRRVRRKGLCPKCGYDLRATPERCPECGTVASSPALREATPPQPTDRSRLRVGDARI